jgi:hypothetical protein
MEKLTSTDRAQPIAPGASVFQSRRLAPVPHSVAIDLGDDTLVITLDEVYSPTEKARCLSGADNAELRETYRRFIADALASMRQHLEELADENPTEAARSFPRIGGGRRKGWARRDPVGRGRL